MVEQEALTQHAPAQEAVPKADYDLHIKIPEEMRATLEDAAELTYRMRIVPKPDLVDLMNLVIVWGFAILKQSYQERKGYR